MQVVFNLDISKYGVTEEVKLLGKSKGSFVVNDVNWNVVKQDLSNLITSKVSQLIEEQHKLITLKVNNKVVNLNFNHRNSLDYIVEASVNEFKTILN